jgi:hypothetical protein
MIKVALATITASVIALFGVALAPLPAFAASNTVITFTDQGPGTVDFGDDWSLVLRVEGQEGSTNIPLRDTDGTVDIYVSGVSGIFAEDLPIQVGGFVYVSQPDDQPLLATGDYEFSAIFNPGKGVYFESAKTKKSASLTVSPLSVLPGATVEPNAAGAEGAVITASLSGSYVEKRGGAPAGTWTFSIFPSGGEQTATWTQDVGQAAGATEPMVVPVTAELDPGMSYTLSTSFTPVSDIATGVTVSPVDSQSFTTPGGGFGGAITSTVPVALWLIIALILIIAGLAIAAIILGSKLGARRAVLDDQDASPVEYVELMSLDEAGLQSLDTHPIPAGSSWLLSDIDSSVGAPTEKLDVSAPVDDETELLNQQPPTDDVPPKDPGPTL